MTAPGVLMVTGAYWPELSGGGLQCRTMIQALRTQVAFRVLTTCIDPGLAAEDLVDGTPVTRLYVNVRRPFTKVQAALRTIGFFAVHHASFGIVHLHGYSQKSILIALLARWFGKKLVITIHTAEQDEPSGVRKLGAVAYWYYSRADRFIAISDRLADNYRAAGLPPARLTVTPNGVDVDRFRPASPEERLTARRSIGGLPIAAPWIVFVGFFSHDKCPDVLFDAWLRLRESDPAPTGLLFVGATDSAYHEVDAGLARRIRDRAAALGLAHLVHFTGEMRDVEQAYRAADVFAMPSAREAFGMALVEAMASGLPVVASRLPGVTDAIVEDGSTGILVPPRDASALAGALAEVLSDPARAAAMGARARAAVVERYSMAGLAGRWLGIYLQAARPADAAP